MSRLDLEGTSETLQIIRKETDYGTGREFQHGRLRSGSQACVCDPDRGGPDADSLPKHLRDDAEKLTKQKNHVVFSFCSGAKEGWKRGCWEETGTPSSGSQFCLGLVR